MKPIALQLYTVRELMKDDYLGTLKQVADVGYKGVETGLSKGRTPEEARRMFDDLGLAVASFSAGLPEADNVASIAGAARTLGTDKLMVGSGPGRWTSPQSIREVAAEFQACAELAAPHGLRLCCHNHWWEFCEVAGQIGYDIFMAAAPGVFGEMDVYWASNFGRVDVPAMVSKYASRLPLLHIKDGPLVKGEKHTAVGAGKMDIPAAIAAADENVLEWLIVEIDACEGDMMQAVRESYDYLIGHGLARGNR